MLGSLFAWIVAVAAGTAAVLFLQRFRSEAERVGALEAELGVAREEIAAGRKREQERGDAQKGRAQEIVELRKRVDKLKKRAGQSRAEQDGAGEQVGRIQTELLEERARLRTLNKDLESARAELVAAREKSAATDAELQALKAERASRPLADDTSIEKLDALRAEAERAQAAEKRAEKAAAKAKRDELRHRKRADNLDKVYMVLRAEHELVCDDLRTQTEKLERLSALKVAVMDPVPEEPTQIPTETPIAGIRPTSSPADALKTS
ncbi:MAG: hypothetical protein GY725_12250 [bacterium]|nr:hypothetical protein [bacterium]